MKYAIGIAILTGIVLSTMLASTPRSEFAPYVELFQKELDARGFSMVRASRMPIVFGPTEGNAIGYCIISGSSRIVIINRGYWNVASEIERELLIFHELGHCILNMEHDETVRPDGTPASIMYPSSTPDIIWSYRISRDAYMDQLFQHIGVRRTN